METLNERILTQLRNGISTSSEVARAIETDQDAVDIALNDLVRIGQVTRTRDRDSETPGVYVFRVNTLFLGWQQSPARPSAECSTPTAAEVTEALQAEPESTPPQAAQGKPLAPRKRARKAAKRTKAPAVTHFPERIVQVRDAAVGVQLVRWEGGRVLITANSTAVILNAAQAKAAGDFLVSP